MKYILSGNPSDVRKVIQENRVRLQRGVIKFTPLEDEVYTDNSDVIATLQERNAELNEMFENECKEHSAACERANDLQIKLAKLHEAGIDIDLILDTPTDVAEVKTEPQADTKKEPAAYEKTEPAADVKEAVATSETDTKTTKTKRSKKT